MFATTIKTVMPVVYQKNLVEDTLNGRCSWKCWHHNVMSLT